tara:strand:- start:2276 stop:3325 length:1050 start_codon:yes stop_codon:yes gene_type:complete
MPSTYTNNGGIELPANGEQASTWGNTVNDNMQIVDRLTNGVGAITLSGTTHALTTSNGVVSDGQYKVLVLGGSPSGTNTITVAPNDAQHLYIVKNNSGQTAAFTQGSGANISVLSGTTKIIYCDGAGSGAAVVDVTGSLDLGALIVGGTTVTATGTELNILDGVTSTTAELNILDGVTSTTAELNILDGVTATAAELNYVDGVTSSIQTQVDAKAANTTQATAVWETGTATTETIVSPANVKAAVEALSPSPVKAWVSFTGSTGAIRASSGVASVTRNSAGNYTITFTAGLMSDANYASLAFASQQTSGTGICNLSLVSQATASCRIVAQSEYYGAAFDPAIVNMSFMR